MSELSPEAHVAAEAAASAVEELHEREAIADAAVEAEFTAADAEIRAANAEAAAEEAIAVAGITAEVTAEIASEASERAEVAHEEASAAVDYGQQALQEVQALRAQVEPVIQRHQNEEAERIASLETAGQVEEVDVTHGNGTGTDNGTGGDNARVSVYRPDRPAGKLRRGKR